MTKITVLNTISGRVSEVSDSVLTHPVFGNYHVEVPEGTKSFLPEKYKPVTADEYKESLKARKSDKSEDAKAPDADKKVDA